jgi:hypothetical protein
MSEPLHPAFCEWLQRNRARMSREAFEAGVVVARWLFLMESGHAGPDAKQYADEATCKFKELLANEPAAARLHDA